MSDILCFIVSLAITVVSVVLIGNADGTFANGITFFSAVGIISCVTTIFVVSLILFLDIAAEIENKIAEKRETRNEAERIMKTVGIEKNEKGRK